MTGGPLRPGRWGPGSSEVTRRHFLPLSPHLPKNARRGGKLAPRTENVRPWGWDRIRGTSSAAGEGHCPRRGGRHRSGEEAGRDAGGTRALGGTGGLVAARLRSLGSSRLQCFGTRCPQQSFSSFQKLLQRPRQMAVVDPNLPDIPTRFKKTVFWFDLHNSSKRI